MHKVCPKCGAPSDAWPNDLCQDCWEDYCSASWWATEGGVYMLPADFDAKWLEARDA